MAPCAGPIHVHGVGVGVGVGLELTTVKLTETELPRSPEELMGVTTSVKLAGPLGVQV